MRDLDIKIHILTMLLLAITFLNGLLIEFPLMQKDNYLLFGIQLVTMLVYLYTLYNLYNNQA